jgi:DNA-binding transcriptional LysR family regulator
MTNAAFIVIGTFVSFKQFMIFAAVARHRNVTRASKELHLSQPGVSQQLKLLERDFGVKLLKRNGRGVDLTDAGWTFLNKITPILSQVEDLNRTFGAITLAPKVESLTVGGSYSTSATLLPSMLATFKKNHPRVDLALRTGNRRQIEQMLIASEIEVALVAGHPPSDRVIAEPFRRYKMTAIITKNHPLAKKSSVSALELAGMPLVIRGSPNRKSTTEDLLMGGPLHGVELNIALRCESPDAIKAAVRAGIGIGILYEDAVKAEINKGEFKIVKLSDLNLEGESWIVYRRDEGLMPAAVEFLRLLRAWRDKDHKSRTTAVSLRGRKNIYSGALFGRHRPDKTPQA